jgi:hypothetical protein
MTGDLRKPFLLLALVMILLVVLAEIGLPLLLGGGLPRSGEPDLSAVPADTGAEPPGIAIFYLALLDGLVLYTSVLIALPLIVPERVHGRVQGCATLILAILLLFAEIVLIIGALVFLMIMVTLLLSPIFGTIAYLALFASFDTSGARAILTLLMALKLAFAVCLVLAHQRFLQNKGLVAIVITSLIANIVVSFLHGFVPGFLVSITDALAAIVVGILAAVWTILFLIGSLPSILKIVRVDRALS